MFMELEDIKQFINSDGDKVIFVENGMPTSVLMSYEAYRKFLQNNAYQKEKEGETIEEENESLGLEMAEKQPFTVPTHFETESKVREDVNDKEKDIDTSTSSGDSLSDGLTLEDLPF